jgi:shikimate 5-dehydrogenase
MPSGKLIGYNTDGQGAVDNILLTQPGKDKPLLASLEGKKVLLLGAGGAAKASAFFLADELGDSGSLTIANRDTGHAHVLAASVSMYSPKLRVQVIPEEEVSEHAHTNDIILNATSKGQGGILSQGTKATYLEPYSALAPADTPSIERGTHTPEAFAAIYVRNAHENIIKNHHESLRIAASVPSNVVFVDAVHTPKESIFLLHGRLTGHQTLNGVGMNVGQAIDGFFNKIMKPVLLEKGLHTAQMRDRIRAIMSA